MTNSRRTLVLRLVLVTALVTIAVVAAGAVLAGSTASPFATGVVDVDPRLAFTGATGAATGMVVTPSGKVLTNNHVIRGASEIRVRIPQTRRTFRASVLGYDVSADVAFLQLRGASRLTTVSLGDSAKATVGQRVTAVGNAGGSGALYAATGTITALERTITVSDQQGGVERLTHLIQTNAALRAGDSGGPLLDRGRHVIGMNTAASAELVFRAGRGDGFAIPIRQAASIPNQIAAGRGSATIHVGATPFLGVSVGVASPARGAVAAGDLVTGVRPGSPAARAGVVPGDVIVSVSGHAVRTPTKLVAVLLRWHPGDRVELVWVDQLGNTRVATLTLASGPPQ